MVVLLCWLALVGGVGFLASTRDMPLPDQGVSHDPGRPLTLPVSSHPLLLPEHPLLLLVLQPATLSTLEQTAEEHPHTSPEVHCG